MNIGRLCPDQRLRCPTPSLCREDCHFNTAELSNGVAQEKLLRGVALPGLQPMSTRLYTECGGEHVRGDGSPRSITSGSSDADDLPLSPRESIWFKFAAFVLGACWIVAAAYLTQAFFAWWPDWPH